ELADAGQLARMRVAELVAPYEPNPNALAAPRLAELRLEPWTVSGAPAIAVDGAALKRGFVQLGEQRVAVFAACSANLGRFDPMQAALLETGFRPAGAPGFSGALLAFDSELREPVFAPRVVL